MGSADRRAVGMEESEISAETLSDPFGRAVLDVHRRIDIGEQIGALLVAAADWSEALFGIAYARSEDGRSWVPCGVSGNEEAGRIAAAGPRDKGGPFDSLAGGARVHEGAGPFEALALTEAGESRAVASITLPAVDRRGEVGGWVLLALAEPPEDGLIGRLDRLLEHCRPAFENGLRVQALRELVIKDDTARCYNRRYFEDFLQEELARAKRFQSPMSLIFLDMDDLKQVNNRFGHAMGSRTLFEVSLRVQRKIRKFDKLFRFGGDEFCIVLPETAWHGALEVAERVRDAILRVPFLKQEMGDDRGIEMSASLGIAAYPLHARNQAELIERADRAMQRVKKTGKNAIGVAEIEAEHAE